MAIRLISAIIIQRQDVILPRVMYRISLSLAVKALSIPQSYFQVAFTAYQIKEDLHRCSSVGDQVDHVTVEVGIWVAN
jgi:hypothetical protein